MNKYALFLLPLLLAGSILRSSIAVVFISNQDAIAATQCEQRNIPNNCCQGSCVLSKVMSKVNMSETSNNPLDSQNNLAFLLETDTYLMSKEEEVSVEAGPSKFIVWLKALLNQWLPSLKLAVQ